MLSLLALVVAAAAVPHADADANAAASTKTIATGLHVPWGSRSCPSGDALVAERTTGRILRVPENGGKPRAVEDRQGRRQQRRGGRAARPRALAAPSSRTARLRLLHVADDNRIVRFTRKGGETPILTGPDAGLIHNGGRIAFGPDGKLYATVGDAANTGNSPGPRLPQRQDPAR